MGGDKRLKGRRRNTFDTLWARCRRRGSRARSTLSNRFLWVRTSTQIGRRFPPNLRPLRRPETRWGFGRKRVSLDRSRLRRRRSTVRSPSIFRSSFSWRFWRRRRRWRRGRFGSRLPTSTRLSWQSGLTLTSFLMKNLVDLQTLFTMFSNLRDRFRIDLKHG